MKRIHVALSLAKLIGYEKYKTNDNC